jgi:hypothetical protein
MAGKEQWLHADESSRSRPWAYEELLFGSEPDREHARERGAIAERLARERAEVAQLRQQLDERFVRIARLETRLHELTPVEEQDEPDRAPARLPRTHAAAVGDDVVQPSPDDRHYLLARCEGFRVDSPTGMFGFVEGLRFVSRIDRPDFLEVRSGRFGRQLLVVPIEQVEEVSMVEERVLVRSAPSAAGDLLGELVGRVRRAMHVDQATS